MQVVPVNLIKYKQEAIDTLDVKLKAYNPFRSDILTTDVSADYVNVDGMTRYFVVIYTLLLTNNMFEEQDFINNKDKYLLEMDQATPVDPFCDTIFDQFTLLEKCFYEKPNDGNYYNMYQYVADKLPIDLYIDTTNGLLVYSDDYSEFVTRYLGNDLVDGSYTPVMTLVRHVEMNFPLAMNLFKGYNIVNIEDSEISLSSLIKMVEEIMKKQ